ncbi:hypothetical protein D9611_005926 [Ephemerocybe angulata]|uniref:Ubiquitin-like domain-containing protein n=1 Tax=Ephemerocybe angulata TaxID=980116 RepID=A0A8H5CGU7_9AGAR|nr:hypothetical protein D9611_005926 [Tulosesus angulatus]
MKFTLAPLVSLLIGASYLVSNAAAYSYNDYNELDARYQIDDVLSERGFGLEARETVDVPFQPSLRAFLEEAVTAHRRSLSVYEEDLEARALINVKAEVHSPGHIKVVLLTVDPNMTVSEFKKQMLAEKGKSHDLPAGMVKWYVYFGKQAVSDISTLREIGVENKPDQTQLRVLSPKAPLP